MIKINLVPQELLVQWRQKQRMWRLSVAAAALLVALVVFSAVLGIRLQRMESLLVARQAEASRLAAVVLKVKEAESLAAALQARLRVIEDLDKGRRAYPLFMSDFVRSAPGGVRVISMTTNGGGGSPVKMNVSARARTNEDIAAWVRRLEESRHFSGIELGPMTVDEGAEGMPRVFTLTASYVPAG